MERWRSLLADLSQELEGQFALMDDLRSKNRQLEDSLANAGSHVLQTGMRRSPPRSPTKAEKSWEMVINSTATLRGATGQRPTKPSTRPSTPQQDAPAVWIKSESTNQDLNLEADQLEDHEPEDSKLSKQFSRKGSGLRGIGQSIAAGIGAGLGTRVTRAGSKQSKVIDDGIQFTVLRAHKTGVYTEQKPRYVINPDRSWLASTWQFVMSFALLFVAFVTPVQVSLLEPGVDGVFVVGFLVDFIFLVDLIMQFFTAYSTATPYGVVWEVRLSHICKHYLKTWFMVDFITVIPWDFLAMFLQVNSLKDLVGIKVIRALRLIKLMRLMKASKILQDLEAPLSIPYQKVALFRFILVLGLTCHWLACCWAVTLSVIDENYPRWIDDIAEADLEFGVVTTESPYRVYVAAFYFCAYTVTSVGYGDISPKNIVERMMCSGLVLAAGLSWAYVIGEVGAITADMTAESQEFRKTMHHLNRMMDDQRVPYELQIRVRRYFLQNKYQSQHVSRQALLKRMSPQLQAEVSVMTNLLWLEKVSFFKSFLGFIKDQNKLGVYTAPYEACVADVASVLNVTAFAQQETFHNVQVLYILSKGLVALNSRVRSLGVVWGEDFVLSDTSLIRPVACYALTYLELLSLTREDFMQIIQRRRFTCPELFRIVRRYCVCIAVYRGILAEARRRQLEIIQAEVERVKAEEAAHAGLTGLSRVRQVERTGSESWSSLSLPGEPVH
mmetsp:Transcript_59245/g.138741  ORF Transcript_59245/g.138741 Transcript_59245/m.138741 type:complete len:725 (-) Transcript_59245:91-2265(-)